MLRKLHWGIAALAIFVVAAAGFIYWQLATVQQLKEELAQEKKQLEQNDKVQHDVSFADEKPPDEPGFEWVRHGDHWDKVPIDAHDMWQEQTPIDATENAQPSKKNDLSAYESNPVSDDFYRDMFSREELESMLKSDQRSVEQLRTVLIPNLEESRKKLLDLLQLVSDAPEYAKKSQKERLAEIEEQLKFRKFELNNYEKMIASKLKVLNEEATNVEE